MRIKVVIPICVLTALLLLTGTALAANGYEITRNVIGGGGGPAANGSYALNSTIGQAVVGRASQSIYDLCAGFWCGVGAEYRIYLPLVLRNF